MILSSTCNSDTPNGELFSEDLITEILLRLPVKPLIRFKSVSKPWLDLISSSVFVMNHMKRSISTSGADETLIICRKDDLSISLVDINSPETVIPIGLPYSTSKSSPEPHFLIVGCCNGVVCVSVSKCPKDIALNCDLFNYASFETIHRKIYVWNPAIRQSKLLRKHKICCKLKSVCIGFGYDPIGDDFKVVRLVLTWNDHPVSAEIYSTNSDVWREVDRPCDYPHLNEFDVCVNGFLCSKVSDGMIVLDLAKEVFTSVLKLPDMDFEMFFDARITSYNGCIAVIGSKMKKFKHIIQLWSLDSEACLRDAGVDASWTLMLNIKVDFPVWKVYGCFNRGELLINAERGAWFLYDSCKKVGKTIPITICDMHNIFTYNESLISISGFEQLNWNAHDEDK